jgi:hypothetical protein
LPVGLSCLFGFSPSAVQRDPFDNHIVGILLARSLADISQLRGGHLEFFLRRGELALGPQMNEDHGRELATLDEWFGRLDEAVDLAASHEG